MGTRCWMIATMFFTGVASAGTPTPHSVAAAKATAKQNPLCQAVTPFFWEIGDDSGALVSASIGVNSAGAPVRATTKMDVASSSKWLYGAYILQLRGAVDNLTDEDIDFLHMTSGYSNMGGDGIPAGTCPASDNPDSINVCLTLLNPANGLPYSYQDPTTTGYFDYDAGHFENHASQFSSLGDLANGSLGPAVSRPLGPSVLFSYSQPLLAGGVYTTPATYAVVLRHIVAATLVMRDALGIDPVCTLASASCQAFNTPIPEAWHYSIAHWVEDDPATHGDGAFSAPGAQGFYPWIEASKAYYGILARVTASSPQQGVASVQCGRLIRRAWDTGVQQRGKLPSAH